MSCRNDRLGPKPCRFIASKAKSILAKGNKNFCEILFPFFYYSGQQKKAILNKKCYRIWIAFFLMSFCYHQLTKIFFIITILFNVASSINTFLQANKLRYVCLSFRLPYKSFSIHLVYTSSSNPVKCVSSLA